MSKKIVKIMLVLLMVAGVFFSANNFLAEKAESATYWQDLETGTDPYTGGTFIKCWNSGQACVTVTPYEP